MKRKHVTAPKSYQPPKGPREHLAYINAQEAGLLRRATDGKASRGPMGLLSFYMEGKDRDDRGRSTGGGSSGGGFGGGGGRDSGAGSSSGDRGRGYSGGGSGYSGGAGGGGGRDSGSGSSDRGYGYSGGPGAGGGMAGRETSRGLGQGAGGSAIGRIAGPSMSQRDLADAMRTGNSLAQVHDWIGRSLADTSSRKYGGLIGASDIGQMAQTVAGEAIGETPDQQAAVANSMFNRMAMGQSPEQVLSAYDANGIRPGTAMNRAYTSAVPGTAAYGAGLAALANANSPYSSFNRTAPDAVRQATHYYNPQDASPSWGGPGFTPYGNHVFGNDATMAGWSPQKVEEARAMAGAQPQPSHVAAAGTLAQPMGQTYRNPVGQMLQKPFDNLSGKMQNVAGLASNMINPPATAPSQQQSMLQSGLDYVKGKAADVGTAFQKVASLSPLEKAFAGVRNPDARTDLISRTRQAMGDIHRGGGQAGADQRTEAGAKRRDDKGKGKTTTKTDTPWWKQNTKPKDFYAPVTYPQYTQAWAFPWLKRSV